MFVIPCFDFDSCMLVGFYMLGLISIHVILMGLYVFVVRGQAEREFKVEVEAIGRVRHKNLVRLLGYCAEGAHRYLFTNYSNFFLVILKNSN